MILKKQIALQKDIKIIFAFYFSFIFNEPPRPEVRGIKPPLRINIHNYHDFVNKEMHSISAILAFEEFFPGRPQSRLACGRT
jgi:hypothetical protein